MGMSASGTVDMGTVNLLLIAKVLFLLAMANGAPVIGKRILGDKMAFPIDGGLMLSDGQPLFGKSKTIRGVVLALVVTTMLAPLVDLEFMKGAMVSAAAMIGDLLSSFLKRRLKIPPSGMTIGLDQIPEALLPALVVRCALPLTSWDIAAIVSIFFVADLLFSRIFFALKIRDQPY
jgi:CDP-diglyceride synthetase